MKEQHLIKMPSIPAFKNIIMDITHQARFAGVDENEEPIYNNNVVLPTIKFVGSVKLHGCVYKDTLITLANGETIPINTIKSGTYIMTYNETTKEVEINKVSKVICQTLDKNWVKLVFDTTELICTADHKIYTKNRGYIEASKLSVNDIFIDT